MKNIKILTLVFALVFLFSSCNSDENNSTGTWNYSVDTSSFKYPIEIGNFWNYQTSFTISDIRPDSIRHYFPANPVTGSGVINSEKDTLINGINTRLFLDRFTENNHLFESRMFYVQEDSALKIFAYRLSKSAYIFPRTDGNNIFFKHNGRSYRSLYELFASRKYGPFSLNGTDTVIIENPPVTTLMYPIVSNKEWLYRHSSNDSLMKKYLNFELLAIGTNNISCVKAQMDWIHWDSEYMYYYYSKYGLLKSDIFTDDIAVTNELGAILGYVDARELAIVNSYHIVE